MREAICLPHFLHIRKGWYFMAVMQGAMIGGRLLPEQEFKDIIKQLFLETDNIKILNNIIDKTIRNIRSNSISAAYKNIEEFETQLLKNPATSIMLITNLNSDLGDYKWYWNKSEKSAIQKSGAISFVKTIKSNLFEEEINEVLSHHLLDMIKLIETTELSNNEINNLFKIYNFKKKENKRIMGSQARENRNLKYIIYGDNPQYKGQIADAFLNHIGNMHKNILTGKTNKIAPILQSVLVEEGANFYQLLIDSTNNTSWYTGGDLILLGENGEVLANIQLKTISEGKKPYIGRISTDKLEQQLLGLKELINKENILDADQFASKMYNMFATSGVIEQVNDKIIDIATTEVKKALNLTK